jgi:hypothetical protein
VQTKAHGLLAEAMAVQDARVGPPPAPGTPSGRTLFPHRARAVAGGADQIQDRGRRVSVHRRRHLRALSGRRDVARTRDDARRDRRLRAGDQGIGRQLLRTDGPSRARRGAGARRAVRRGDQHLQGARAAERTVRCRSTAS